MLHVIVCDVEFGCWVCGDSWLAIKTLTHRLGSQGGAPGVLLSCHVMCINFVYVCFVWIFLGL